MKQVVLRSVIMNIQIIEISKLKRAKYNPRKELKPEDEEYKKLEKSIDEFGHVFLTGKKAELEKK